MATAQITPDQDVVVSEIEIAVPPERVFQAITDPAQLLQWWGQQGLYRTKKWCTDVRAGGKWSSAGVGADGREFEVHGEYLEVDPPRLLVYTWTASWTGGLQTTVRWELHAGGKGTQVKIRHSGFAGNVQAAQDHGNGWQRVLGWMQEFVETGETADTRQPAATTK